MINTEEEDSINYRIANYLLQNLNSMEHFSATKIAEKCNVSKAAVSRFCRQLGLEDFLEMQILHRVFNRSSDKKFKYRKQGEHENLIEDYLEASNYTIRELKDSIDENDLNELVDDIAKYKNVAAFGHLQSGNIAFTLQHDLTTCDKYIYSSHRYHAQKEYILNATVEDLIILFSAEGNYLERTFLSDSKLKLKNRKPKIYLITVKDKEKAPYIYKVIRLSSTYDYSTSTLAFTEYVSLIALLYHDKYVSCFKN